MLLPTRAPTNVSAPEPSIIAGSVLPIQRAEELLATLPGVISARIVASSSGAVEEIHILTRDEIAPKQTVRNVESALIAHLGMRVSHKKISVATSHESARTVYPPEAHQGLHRVPRVAGGTAVPDASRSAPPPAPVQPPAPEVAPKPVATSVASAPKHASAPSAELDPANAKRRLYFEDVEVRRSRSKGVACRVTLRKGDQSFIGEAEGLENERLRVELAARATLAGISQAEGDARVLGLEGCKCFEAFDRQFVFVGVTTRQGRESALLTGSAEIKESSETAGVLAILDATNRWIDYGR